MQPLPSWATDWSPMQSTQHHQPFLYFVFPLQNCFVIFSSSEELTQRSLLSSEAAIFKPLPHCHMELTRGNAQELSCFYLPGTAWRALRCNRAWRQTPLQPLTCRNPGEKQTDAKLPLRQESATVCSFSDGVQNAPNTLAPIRHMSLVMCDCIISAMSWDWLAVLMNVWLLSVGHGALEPAGT